MPVDILKNLIGFSLVGLHICAVGLCYIWLDSFVSRQEFNIIVLILTPVTAVYAMAFVKDIIKHNLWKESKRTTKLFVSWEFSAISLVFTISFGALVIYNLYNFFSGGNLSADDLKERLALIEVVVGAFIGIIADTLFGNRQTESGEADDR